MSSPGQVGAATAAPPQPSQVMSSQGLNGAQQPVNQPSSSSLSIIITEEHRNAFRLLLILDKVARLILHEIFSSGATRKDPNETLESYLKNTVGLSNTKYNKVFNETLQDKIAKDKTCKSFDITLWVPAILLGCDTLFLSHGVLQNPPSLGNLLEESLKKIKDFRNSILHNALELPEAQFHEKVQKIRTLLIETLDFAKDVFGITETIVINLKVEINSQIDNLMKHDLYDYSEIYEGLKVILLRDGRKDLVELLDKVSQINPASRIAHCNFTLEVEVIFTSLEIFLKGSDDKKPMNYVNLLEYAHELQQKNKNRQGQIILIEGVAGSGKSTLLKFFLSDWAHEKFTVMELDRYKFVLFIECKDKSYSKLKEVIRDQMKTARKFFQKEDCMKEILLDHPTLIIIDGLDELNSDSESLFNDILSITKVEDFMIICTTRPEKVKHYYQLVRNQNTIHVRVKGVSKENIELFVRKYHDLLVNKGISTRDTNNLLKYLSRVGASLHQFWLLPVNLTYISLLWALKPDHISPITTATELLCHIHELIVKNLQGRLLKYEKCRCLSPSRFDEKLKIFTAALCRGALLALSEDDIILEEPTIKLLKETCDILGLDTDEVLSAFLVCESSDSSITVCVSPPSFSHKGEQDFYASKYISMELLELNPSQHNKLVVEKIMNSFSEDKVPPHVKQKIIKSSSDILERRNETIREVLEEVLEMDSEPMEKYQNMFISLLGLFYREGNKVSKKLMKELVNLLEMSGIKTREEWIRVLNSVHCNDTVAKVVSRVKGVMEGTIIISDENVFAYATLFKHYEPPDIATGSQRQIQGLECVDITIRGNPLEVPRFDVLLKEISKIKSRGKDLNLYVKDLNLQHLYRNLQHLYRNPQTSSAYNSLVEGIVQFMKSCDMKSYMGPVTPKMALPSSLRYLYASVTDASALRNISQLLQSNTSSLERFHLCVNHDIDSRLVTPFPSLLRCSPDLFISDVTDKSNIDNVSLVLKGLQPADDNSDLYDVCFPRLQLTSPEIVQLIEALPDSTVFGSLVFPSKCKPSSLAELQEINEAARNSLNCDVDWGDSLDGTIDDWDTTNSG